MIMQKMRGLFLGIGGTGDEVLSHLKDKVYATNGFIPENVQFRLFDTEAEEYRKNNAVKVGDNDSAAYIGDNEYVQLKDEPPGSFRQMLLDVSNEAEREPEVARWCKADLFLEHLADADFNLVRGAGQHRQFARLGVFLNRQRIINTLRHALRKCQTGEGETPLWIIGSIAGGTGAGLLCDIALLTRWVAEDMGQHVRIMGAAILPDVYGGVGIDPARANSVLRELERFQGPVNNADTGRANVDGRNLNSRFQVDYDSMTKIALTGKLFDNLVFYNRNCQGHDQRSSYFSEIADGLNLLLDNSAGDQLFREWINTREGYASSFNTFRVFIPANLYARQFVLKSALEFAADGLLPRDPDSKVLQFGNKADRIDDAHNIFDKEMYQLFSELKKPQSDEEFATLRANLKAADMVDGLLGFANPNAVFGVDIGDVNKRKAKRLYANIYAEIETCKSVKENFEEAQQRIEAEVRQAHEKYWGDGESSFRRSLEAVDAVIKDKIKDSINSASKSYLSRWSVNEQAFGRLIRVFSEFSNIIKGLKDNLAKLTQDWAAEAEACLGQETDALRKITSAKKSLLGWRSKMAELQLSYLDRAANYQQIRQKIKLKEYITTLLTFAEQHVDNWLEGMREWQLAIDGLVDAVSSENVQIEQRLERQTKIRSASMGLNNTADMNGYREYLQAKCMVDPDTDTPVVAKLLNSVEWLAADDPRHIKLHWPGSAPVSPAEFSDKLVTHLEAVTTSQMSKVDGIAKYLKWLRDVKHTAPDTLANAMRNVTADFIDQALTSDSRSFVLLYGDEWITDQYGRDEFTEIHNKIGADTNIAGAEVKKNLSGSDGVNLFQDKNTLAIMMSDNRIEFDKIPAVKRMRQSYIDARADESAPWRSLSYHLFRAEQEAWNIERDGVLRVGEDHFPLIPGEFTRLLDDPQRIRLFGKALVCGIIREYDLPMEGKIWVAGALDTPIDKLVYLNDPHNDKEARDLFRAFVTFVEDRKDRRTAKRGKLDAKDVDSWIGQALQQHNATLASSAQAFKQTHGHYLDIEHIVAGSTITKDDFLALALNHYLKNLLS